MSDKKQNNTYFDGTITLVCWGEPYCSLGVEEKMEAQIEGCPRCRRHMGRKVTDLPAACSPTKSD